jgi:hypothetical protein
MPFGWRRVCATTQSVWRGRLALSPALRDAVSGRTRESAYEEPTENESLDVPKTRMARSLSAYVDSVT